MLNPWQFTMNVTGKSDYSVYISHYVHAREFVRILVKFQVHDTLVKW